MHASPFLADYSLDATKGDTVISLEQHVEDDKANDSINGKFNDEANAGNKASTSKASTSKFTSSSAPSNARKWW